MFAVSIWHDSRRQCGLRLKILGPSMSLACAVVASAVRSSVTLCAVYHVTSAHCRVLPIAWKLRIMIDPFCNSRAEGL